MKKILAFVILVIPVLGAFAQQDPQFTQNQFLKLPVNPGYAGTRGTLCGLTAYRTQWVGFSGSPKTFLFSLDAPALSLNGGIGLTVMKDKLGNFNFTHTRGAYSYHRVMNSGIGILGLGVELGMLQSSIDYNWVAPDGSHGEFDEAVPQEFLKKATYDIGLGAYYRTDKLYVGFSTSHVPGNAEQLTSDPNFHYKAARHFYVMAGYNFQTSRTIVIRPSLFAKSDLAVTTFDLHCDLLYNNNVWAGLSYRMQDALAPSAGVAFQPNGNKSSSMIKIGYSYDIGLSDLKEHHANTHEILVSYCIAWGTTLGSHMNPRLMGDRPSFNDEKFTTPHWYD